MRRGWSWVGEPWPRSLARSCSLSCLLACKRLGLHALQPMIEHDNGFNYQDQLRNLMVGDRKVVICFLLFYCCCFLTKFWKWVDFFTIRLGKNSPSSKQNRYKKQKVLSTFGDSKLISSDESKAWFENLRGSETEKVGWGVTWQYSKVNQKNEFRQSRNFFTRGILLLF